MVFEAAIDLNPSGFEASTRDNTIALLNFGGLRAPINQGEITVGNVFELMPFDNTIMMVRLKPQAIAAMLDYLLEKGGQPVSNSRFELSESVKNLYVHDKAFNLEKRSLRDYFQLPGVRRR